MPRAEILAMLEEEESRTNDQEDSSEYIEREYDENFDELDF